MYVYYRNNRKYLYRIGDTGLVFTRYRIGSDRTPLKLAHVSFRGYLLCAAQVKLSEKNESARYIFIFNWHFLPGKFLFLPFYYIYPLHVRAFSVHLKRALIFHFLNILYIYI